MTTFAILSITSLSHNPTDKERLPMANKIVQEIRDKYEFYTKLLAERKSIFDKVIEIIQLGNNRNFLEKSTELKHIPVTDETILIVTVKVYDYKYFQFKLRCKGLSDTPFFR